MGWTYAFLNRCELESFHESYSSGILPDKISKLQLHWAREVNERLCIGEVGVDLELCVHAHGHDVDLIMEASCNNNYFLENIIWICELILCNRGSDHDCSSLISFLGQVTTIVFYGSIHQSNLYFDLVSSITPWCLKIIMELHNFLWVLHQVLPFHWFQLFTGSELLYTQRDR